MRAHECTPPLPVTRRRRLNDDLILCEPRQLNDTKTKKTKKKKQTSAMLSSSSRNVAMKTKRSQALIRLNRMAMAMATTTTELIMCALSCFLACLLSGQLDCTHTHTLMVVGWLLGTQRTHVFNIFSAHTKRETRAAGQAKANINNGSCLLARPFRSTHTQDARR